MFASVFSMGVPVKPMNDAFCQGIEQVAGEAVGHLAGPFIYLATESILAGLEVWCGNPE